MQAKKLSESNGLPDKRKVHLPNKITSKQVTKGPSKVNIRKQNNASEELRKSLQVVKR